MDEETKQIVSENKLLLEMVETNGWRIARKKIADKIMDLQNAFNIDDSDPQKLIIDLNARKLATQILFDWLREIESARDVVIENKPKENSSFIVSVD